MTTEKTPDTLVEAEVPGTTPEVAPPTTVSQEEYQKVQTEAAALKAKLEVVEQRRADENAVITRLAQERDAAKAKFADLNQEMTNKKMDILAKAQAGVLDESHGTVDQQLAKVDAEASAMKQALQAKVQYETYVAEQGEVIKGVLTEGGFDPMSSEPEVAELNKAFWETVNQGKSLESIVAKATKVVTSKMKASQPDIEKIKEDIRRDVLEEFKKSGILKVDTGAPSGPGERHFTLQEVETMSPSEYAKNREQIRKALHEGKL